MTNKIIEYFKPDAVIEKPKADALLELTPEIKTKILSCKPINEATVHAATATSRRQARVWLAQMNAAGELKTKSELIAAKVALEDPKEI